MADLIERKWAVLAGIGAAVCFIMALLAFWMRSSEASRADRFRTERIELEGERSKLESKLTNAQLGKHLQTFRAHVQMLAVVLDNADSALWTGELKGKRRPAEYNALYGALEEMAAKNAAFAKIASDEAKALRSKLPADLPNDAFPKAVDELTSVADETSKLLTEQAKAGGDQMRFHARITDLTKRFQTLLVTVNELSRVF
jgi:soluble cytochrome b562